VRTHECRAVGCMVLIPRHRLMCRDPWRKVPHSEQQAVLAAFTPPQLHTLEPSRAWWRASRAAILRAALAEGRFTYAQAELFGAGTEQIARAAEVAGGAA
jgi:hypothetical protein